MWLYYVRRYRKVALGCFGTIVFLLIIIYGIKTTSIKKNPVVENSYPGKAMGTAIKKTIYSDDEGKNEMLSKQIDDCLKNLENQISIRIVDSDVAKCNRNYTANGIFRLPENVVSYVADELEIASETNGAFNPCIYPLSSLWKIEDGGEKIPDSESIAKQLSYIDYNKISVVKDGIIIGGEKMGIDFGATGKGIACDEIAQLVKESEAEGAVVSVGGSIVICGSKGNSHDWHIGIRNPRGDEDDVMGVLDCGDNTFVSTSGDYEKYFEENGIRYHHILDPQTGYPVDNNLMSVTIVSDSGFLSDALSTACFVLGLKDGMKYAKKKNVEAIFITRDNEVYITKGLKDTFRLKGDSYHLAK